MYSLYSAKGYRTWFANDLSVGTKDIFVLDFESVNKKTEDKSVNGVVVYYKTVDNKKKCAFMELKPYFYLKLERSLLGEDRKIIKIIQQVYNADSRINDVVYVEKYDATDLTFLKKYPFLKVIVDYPGAISSIKDKFFNIVGVQDHRESDFLYHHRVAIDTGIRVGQWFSAEIDKGIIYNIKPIYDRAAPDLKVLALDLETEYHPERDPSITEDEILINILFTGDENYLIVQKNKVNVNNIKDFKIVLREPDGIKHKKLYVDWVYLDDNSHDNLSFHDEKKIKVVIVNDQEELIKKTYEIIDIIKPDIIADFYGNKFDMPFLYEKSRQYGLDFELITGFRLVKRRNKLFGNLLRDVDYVSSAGVLHIDAFLFNEKYSYLPNKDLGLKQSVAIKLKIDPIGREALKELAKKPEDAVGYAGCDGYITWRYVREIVLDFFLSMGQVFPVTADEIFVRRAGSLDDLLVDSEGCLNNIVSGKRLTDSMSDERLRLFTEDLYVDSLKCTGAFIDVWNDGVFRSDLKYNINIDTEYLKNDILPLMVNAVDDVIRKMESDNWVLISDPHSELDNIINDIIKDDGMNVNLLGGHADVTSMYPSVIRQYKLQPNSIISPLKCLSCPHKELDDSCFVDFKWTLKMKAVRTCKHYPCDLVVNGKCDDACKKYESVAGDAKSIQEVFAVEDGNDVCYRLRNKRLVKIPLNESTFGMTDPYMSVRKWIKILKDEYDITTGLENSIFEYIKDTIIDYPKDTYLIVDARKKNALIYLGVRTRVCQKSYGHVAKIMEDFFNRRVEHKRKAKELYKTIINDADSISDDVIRQQKFHKSTQLGLKVPLNSIYGLMGMKQGVRNSLLAGAGITTAESAKIILFAAKTLDRIGIVTEFDTDGAWFFLDKRFPQNYTVRFKKNNIKKDIVINMIEYILNSQSSKKFRNENYWVNDGAKIYKSPRSLIKFEYDGPYDFQFVMGKKKYVVYSYEKNGWVRKEITGLETKRSDFTLLQKDFQNDIINCYLSHFNDGTFKTVKDLYCYASEQSKKLKDKIKSGDIAVDKLIKPKSIKKDISLYNQNLPQIRAGKIYQMLGYEISGGTKINIVKLQNGFVVPYELFNVNDSSVFLSILRKINFMPLLVIGGKITKPSDLLKYLDTKEYLREIFGKGRIYDRMVGNFIDN